MKKYLFIVLLVGVGFGQEIKVNIEDSLYVVLQDDSTWRVDSNIEIKTKDGKNVIIYPDNSWEYIDYTDEQKIKALKDRVISEFLSYNDNVIKNAYRFNIGFYKIILHPFIKINEPPILIMTLYPYLIDKLIWRYNIQLNVNNYSSLEDYKIEDDNFYKNPEFLQDILNDSKFNDLRSEYFKKFMVTNLLINIFAYLLSDSMEDLVRIL
tara:strand:- start:1106 stop:1732 length:627 start_codon:yes stop_codon:yes gene_type:complete